MSPQIELVLSPDNHFFELLGTYMLDLEKDLQTVRGESYALGAVRSDLSVGWYNFRRDLTLIWTADGAGGMSATAVLMGDVICAATTSRRRSGLTAAGSKSKNRPEDIIDDYMIVRTSEGERWDFNFLESRTEFRVVRGRSRGDDRDGDGVPILVDAVLMDGRQRRGDSDNDVDVDEDCSGLICSREGWTRNFDRPRGDVPAAAEIMAGRA